MDSPPSIFIEPPEDDRRLVSGQEIPPYTDFRPPGDETPFLYSHSNNSNDSVLSHDLFPTLFLDTFGLNFTGYRAAPDSPNSPLHDPFPDDVSDFGYTDCPSPGAFSDSPITPGSPYSTALHETLSHIHFQDTSSPQLPSANDTGPNSFTTGDFFPFSGYNGSYDDKSKASFVDSSSYDPEPYVEDGLLAAVPLTFPQPRAHGHRSMLSEPYIPTNSFLMEPTGPESHQQPLTIQTDTSRHHRSHSESIPDLLSPDSAHMRGRGRSRSGSRPGSRMQSPYMRPTNASQESLHDPGSAEPYLVTGPDTGRRTPRSSSASFPGTPILGCNSEASASSQSLVSPSSTSIMVMNSGKYEFADILSGGGVTPRKVGSEKLDEASNKRRRNEAKYFCELCNRALTTKHNVKNHMKSHFNIKDHICEDCGKGFTTGHVLKRHWKICPKRKKRLGEHDEAKESAVLDESKDSECMF